MIMYEAFMEDLKSASSALYDFVKVLGENLDERKGRLMIDDVFVRYFKIYEGELKVKRRNIEKMKPDMEEVLWKAKELCKADLRRMLKRKIRKSAKVRLDKSLKRLKKIKVNKEVVSKMENYIPGKFKPLLTLINEMKLELKLKT